MNIFKLALLAFLCLYGEMASASALPTDSRLIDIGGRNIHVREQGVNQTEPTIILLAGPNENWHSDSAWFALLQPMLAERFRVIAIDRAGQAWSDKIEHASYQQFADDLATVYKKLQLKEVVLVCYSSSNITSLLLQKNHPDVQISAQLWLDPDILLPHSIALYSGSPASWYKQNIAEILPHIAQGNWTERTTKKNNNEQAHIKSLINEANKHWMDWSYFLAIQAYRTSISAQQTRAIEIANYADDLAAAAKVSPTNAAPITIIDTDFELTGIDNSNEDYDKLQKWQREGSQWSKDIAHESGGYYLPLNTADHLVTFQHPEKVQAAILQLLSISKQK